MPVTFEFDLDKFEFIHKRFEEARKDVVRKQLEKRFGRLPESVAKRLGELSNAETEKLALDLLDARSLEESFGDLPVASAPPSR